MPGDQTLKTILLKIGVDLSQFNQAADRIRGSLNDISKIGSADGKGGGGSSAVRKQIDQVRELQAATRAAAQTDVAAARQAFAQKKALLNQEYSEIKRSYQDRKSSAANYTQTAKRLNAELYQAEKDFVAARYAAEVKLAGTTANKAVEAEKIKQAAIHKTTDLIQAQYSSQVRGGRMATLPGRQPGFFGRLTGGFMRGGFTGAMGGIAAGGLLFEGIESLIEKFKQFGEELREYAQIASQEAQLYQTMRSVAGGRVEDERAYIGELRESSRYLVGDAQLVRTATSAFRNNSSMTAGQLRQLVSDVTKLGVAAYGPSGAARGIQALGEYLTSGRGYALAYALQLTQMDRVLLSSSRTSMSTAAAMAQFNQSLAIIHREAERTAEPVVTVAMAERQYATSSEQLKIEIMSLLETSPGLVAIWKALATSANKALGNLETARDKWASIIDDFTQVLATSAEAIVSIIAVVAPLLARVAQIAPRIGAKIHYGKASSIQNTQNQWAAMQRDLRGASPGYLEFLQSQLHQTGIGVPSPEQRRMSSPEINTAITNYLKSLEYQKNREYDLAQQSYKTYQSIGNLGTAAEAAAGQLLSLIHTGVGAKRGTTTPTGGARQTPIELSNQEQVQLASEQARNRDTERQTELEKEKAADEQRLQALQFSLRQGEVSEQEYHDKAVALQKDLYQVTLKMNESRAQAQVESLKASLEDPRLTAPKIKSARLEQQKADVDAYAQLQKAKQDLNEQTTAEERQEALKRAETNRDLASTDFEENQKKNALQFQSGKKTVSDYYSTQRSLYRQEIEAYQDATAQIVKMAGISADERVAIEQAATQKITILNDEITTSRVEQQKAVGEEAIRAAASQVTQAQRRYGAAKIALERRGIEQPQVQNTMLGQQIQDVIAASQAEQQVLQQQISGVAKNTDQWYTLNQQLDAVNQVLEQFQKTLEATDTSLKTRLLHDISAIGDMLTGKGSISSGLQASADAISGGVENLQKAYAGYKGLLKPTSVMGAMQSGQQLGGAVGGFFGPVGEIIGSAIGGVVGAVRGIFTAASRHIAEQMERAFDKIAQTLEEGRINLGQAIQQEQDIYNQFIARESGQKGGQQQIAQYGPQMQQQIASLKAQQAQTFEQFGFGADIGKLPVVIQDIGQQVSSLIQNYQQYIDAGGSVKEANQSLSESFTKLGQSIATELNQSYTDAIQNAIQYNDLLQQRLQLEYSTAEQERGILSQGVLSRSTTQAQSEMYKIEELNRQKSLQLQQLDPQIAIAQAKLKAEQQIFNLATTRVGLEQQLVTAQQYTINLDVQRILLLQAMMAQLGKGQGILPSFASTILQTIIQTELSQGGVITSQSAINALLAAWGITPSNPGATSPTTTSPSAASQALEDMFNSYFNLQGRYGQQGSRAQR